MRLASLLVTLSLFYPALGQAADAEYGNQPPGLVQPEAITESEADHRAATVTRWADRCTNLTSSGWAFKAPNNFVLWLDVFSAPDIWLEFARRGMDPKYLVRSMDTMLDPATAQNFLEWTDPYLYERWLGALSQPDFLNEVTHILTQPERLARWATLPLDPRPWQLLVNGMNPETWAKWLGAPFAPDTQALIAKALDPKTAEAWERVLSDPRSYPALQGWQQSQTGNAYNRPGPTLAQAPRAGKLIATTRP